MLSIEELTDDSRELNIEEVTDYILAIPKFAEKIGTEDLKVLMKKLGDPQDKVKSVHIAGTNGKGSTTEMIRLMLTEAGYKTGAFTSPHLVRINERIAIDGVMISDEDFISCFKVVLKTVHDNGLRHPSFFEFIFAMAALYYAEKNADYVVYETGMGGRLDATNIITPVVSVITSVGMDHMQYLGDTIEKIAYEKAGIIKPGVPVVHNAIAHEHEGADGSYGDIEPKEKALDVIRDRAEELSAELFVIDHIDDRLRSWLGEDESEAVMVNPVFLTQYQRENASAAIRAFLLIMEESGRYNYRDGEKNGDNTGVNIGEKADENITGGIDRIILKALNKFIMPARMEMLRKNVIIDGAHNTDAMPQFLSAAAGMIDRVKPEKVYFIFAVSNDKDYRNMVRMIYDAELFDEIFLTTFNSSRKTDVEVIKEIFEEDLRISRTQYSPVVRAVPEVRRCLDEVLPKLGERDLLFTAGSLYLAGEIEEILGNKEE